jgi:hypothetical protein
VHGNSTSHVVIYADVRKFMPVDSTMSIEMKMAFDKILTIA